MSATRCQSRTAPGDVPAALAEATAEEKVRHFVRVLLSGTHPAGAFKERRRDQRFPLARLIRLTPVGPDGAPLAEAVVVVGKDVSERGLGFYHPQPLAQRRMIASIETRGGAWLEFLIDINWCRFTKHGWYDSGGRLLQVVERGPAAEGAGETERGASRADRLSPNLADESVAVGGLTVAAMASG